MKNVLFGLAVGVVVGYVLRRMEDQGQFECLENELHGLTDKAKKKVKDVVDTGKNQVEYVKDRVEHMVEKPKIRYRPVAWLTSGFCDNQKLLLNFQKVQALWKQVKLRDLSSHRRMNL